MVASVFALELAFAVKGFATTLTTVTAGATVIAAFAVATLALGGGFGKCSAEGGVQDFALVDPHLAADLTVGGVCFSKTILDVGAQGLQGDGTLVIAFAAGDFSTAQTAAAGALDALSTQTGGGLHGLLHSAAEGDALFQLLSDVLSNQLCVQVRAADLNDVQIHGLAQTSFHVLAQIFDLSASLTDDNTGAGAVDVDLDLAIGTLDLDLSNTSCVQLVLQILTDVVIFDDQVTDLVLAGVPAGIPILDNAYPQSMGINFLSQSYLLIKPSRSHQW